MSLNRDQKIVEQTQLMLSAQQESILKNCNRIVVENIFYKYKLSGDAKKEINLVDNIIYDDQFFRNELILQRNKYDKYVEILSEKLNKYHNLNKSKLYWERIIGLLVLMHLHHTRYIYNFFFKNKHSGYSINLLNTESFQTPETSEDYRDIVQFSYLGYEQLVSEFFQLFKDQFKFKLSYYKKENTKKDNYLTSINLNDTSLFARILGKSIEDIFLSFFLRIISYISKKLFNPTILLVETIFTPKNYLILILKSFGRIQFINSFRIPYRTRQIDNLARNNFFGLKENNLSDYDKFFFTSLDKLFPKSLLENFKDKRSFVQKYLKKFKKLNYIISETSLEDTQLLISESKEKNIKFICNEHNWIQHNWLGNKIWFHASQSDYFLSLGWHSDCKNIIPAGSLFRWKVRQNQKNDISILFVSSYCQCKMTHLDSHGESGSKNIQSFIKMNNDFFGSLNNDILKKIHYRPHPNASSPSLKENNLQDSEILPKHLETFKCIDNRKNIKAEKLMARSQVIVVNYFSTPWLQALLSNKPTIILWNSEAWLLEENYSNYFEQLEKANIIQRDPKNAAKFLSSIINDPMKWWLKKETIFARKMFLENNFLGSNNLKKLLLKLSMEKNTFNKKKDTKII